MKIDAWKSLNYLQRPRQLLNGPELKRRMKEKK